MELDDVGCRHAFAAAQFVDAVAERTGVSAGLTQPLQALCKQPCDGGFAVRARDAQYFDRVRWMAVEAIRNFPETAAQRVDRDERRADVGNRPGRRGVVRNSRSARLDRLSCIVEPMAALATIRKKQVTFDDIARVARDAADRHVRRLGNALQQGCNRHRRIELMCRHAHRLIAWMMLPGSRAGSASGGTASKRSDSVMTSAKTGAATSLP